MKFSFSGYYGMNNTGDDCFCLISGWGAMTYWKAKKIYYISKKIPSLPFNAKTVLLSSLPNRIDFINDLFLSIHLLRNPIVIFAGGSIFHGREGKERSLILKAFSLKKIKLGAIGVSLGPYKTVNDEKKVHNMLKKLSFLCLRDKKSFDEASSLSLEYKPVWAFDLAGLLPLLPYIKRSHSNFIKSKNSLVLGLVVCEIGRSDERLRKKNEHRIFTLIESVKLLKKHCSLKIKLLIFNGNYVNGDISCSKQVFYKLSKVFPCKIIPYSSNPLKMWEEILECDLVISYRLHGAIYACMGGIPFILCEAHEKAKNFLNDISYPLEYRIGDFDIDSHELSRILEVLLSKQDLLVNPDQLIKRALLNFTSIKWD